MKIVLHENKRHFEPYSDEGAFLLKLLGNEKIRYAVNTSNISMGFDGVPTSPLVQASVMAFAQHMPLRLDPAYFWVTILQELATTVKLNPVRYATVFNGDPENKKKIIVRCDELWGNDSAWPLAIRRFQGALANEIGSDKVGAFFPGFSDDDETRRIAYLVSLMDAASPYFDYEVWTLCGIPEIYLDGQYEDWKRLEKSILGLKEIFGGELDTYFDRVAEIVSKIASQVFDGKPDMDWWKSFVKYMDMSGNTEVSGWLTDFYRYVYTEGGPILKEGLGIKSYSTNLFPSGLSIVPFVWQLMDERFPMRFFAGLTGSEMRDGAITPLIGYGVIEGEG